MQCHPVYQSHRGIGYSRWGGIIVYRWDVHNLLRFIIFCLHKINHMVLLRVHDLRKFAN